MPNYGMMQMLRLLVIVWAASALAADRPAPQLEVTWRTDLDAALADCNRAIELDPENKEYYSERAVVYTARGEHEKANADFKQAYRIGRKHTPVRQ